MTDNIPNWEPAPDLAKGFGDTEELSRGWTNTVTEEVIVRQPLTDDKHSGLPEIGVYHYLGISEDYYIGTNRRLLFRGDDINTLDERVESIIREADTPNNPDSFDTAVDPVKVRRKHLETIANIEDWAHVVGADFYIGEKIGNRKESSGSVAIFEGSTRRGEGAYVALASENGPRGRPFASVGYKSGGYYTTAPSIRRNAWEVEQPAVKFDDTTITISSPNSDRSITIEPQTGNPSECVREQPTNPHSK